MIEQFPLCGRILVELRDKRILQFPEPQLEQRGRDVGVTERLQRQRSLVHLQLERVHFINIPRYSERREEGGGRGEGEGG